MTDMEIKAAPADRDGKRAVSSCILASSASLTAAIGFIVQYGAIHGLKNVDRQRPSWFNLDEGIGLGMDTIAMEVFFAFGFAIVLAAFVQAMIGAVRRGSSRGIDVLVLVLIIGIEAVLAWEFMPLARG